MAWPLEGIVPRLQQTGSVSRLKTRAFIGEMIIWRAMGLRRMRQVCDGVPVKNAKTLSFFGTSHASRIDFAGIRPMFWLNAARNRIDS
jgi:hypothetical protein